MAKKDFSIDKYDKIKKLLTDSKVSSADLANYIKLKSLRYARHKEELELTDEEMIAQINLETK